MTAGFRRVRSHRATELAFTFAGRPIKPVAFGLAVIMCGLCVYNALGLGTFGTSVFATAYAILSLLAAGLLTSGWVGGWQRVAEWGLLLSCWVLATRALFVLLTEGWGERATVLSTGCAIIAGGSYLLERMADGPPGD